MIFVDHTSLEYFSFVLPLIYDREVPLVDSGTVLNGSFVPWVSLVFPDFDPSVGGSWSRVVTLWGMVPLFHSLPLTGPLSVKVVPGNVGTRTVLGGLRSGPGDLAVSLDDPQKRLHDEFGCTSGCPGPRDSSGQVTLLGRSPTSVSQQSSDTRRRCPFQG